MITRSLWLTRLSFAVKQVLDLVKLLQTMWKWVLVQKARRTQRRRAARRHPWLSHKRTIVQTRGAHRVIINLRTVWYFDALRLNVNNNKQNFIRVSLSVKLPFLRLIGIFRRSPSTHHADIEVRYYVGSNLEQVLVVVVLELGVVFWLIHVPLHCNSLWIDPHEDFD